MYKIGDRITPTRAFCETIANCAADMRGVIVGPLPGPGESDYWVQWDTVSGPKRTNRAHVALAAKADRGYAGRFVPWRPED